MQQERFLYLVRHAKSSWRHDGLPDYDRPLNRRGAENAPLMARRLQRRQVAPDLIISSPALRAVRTATVFAQQLNGGLDRLRLDAAIYHGDALVLLQRLMAVSDQVRQLMLVGHNPSLTVLCNQLGGPPLENIVTAGVVAFRFNGATWSELHRDAIERLDYDYPKRSETVTG
ncbi:MAG: phosphohistidine phosphatase SixA [Wenzhouxiangellaceae bacterium]